MLVKCCTNNKQQRLHSIFINALGTYREVNYWLTLSRLNTPGIATYN